MIKSKNSAPFSIAVLVVGYELLSGQISDSNSAWIGELLLSNGLKLREVRTCDDDEKEIIRCLEALLNHHDAVVVSGGLGPTTDDLTREAIAAVSGKELVQNETELLRIKDLFKSRNREYHPSNDKQALIPEGATVIENPVGTAPGFKLNIDRAGKTKTLFTLPGVPRELKLMFKFGVLPTLQALSGIKNTSAQSLLRVFGLSESQIGGAISALKLDPQVTISYRAHFPEIRVGFRADKGDHNLSQRCVAECANAAALALGEEYIFSTNPEHSIEHVVHHKLKEKKLTLSVAESCTAGMLGMLLTELAGSSEYFLGGILTYSNELKHNLLNLDSKVLQHFGAVSPEVAEMMAIGVRRVTGSKLSLSITGVAGPGGGTEEKPVGLFYVGFCSETKSKAFRFFYPVSRELVRKYACYCALDILRRHMLGLELRGKQIP